MSRLTIFQYKRLYQNKIIYLLLVLLFLIGVAGMILGHIFYGEDASPQLKLISIYNAYTQFTYLILIYIFISNFANDFNNGVYSFMSQIGYSIKKNVCSKAIILIFLNITIIDVFIILMNFIYKNKNKKFLLTMILTIDFSVVFIIALAVLLSIIIKKTTIATLIAYGLFVILNILNFISYGLFNPADGNSISTYCLKVLAGLNSGHYTLEKIKFEYDKYGAFIAILSPLIWSVILLIAVLIIINRIGKVNTEDENV